MDDELLGLLEYDGILSAVATTPDGLVVAAAGLSGDDAEILGAAGSMLFDPSNGNGTDVLDVATGTLHVSRGDEVSIVVLSEASVPHVALEPLLESALGEFGGVFA